MQPQTTTLVSVPPKIDDQLPWLVGPSPEESLADWLACRDEWLSALEARSRGPNTRRAYERDTREFFAFFANETRVVDGQVEVGLKPWWVGRLHAQRWVRSLRERGLADSTINRKVAACSSFYRWAMDEYQITTPTGPRSLWEHPNPFGSRRLRTKVSQYGQASAFPSSEEFRLMFAVIPDDTAAGLRDLALLLGMFITTRRVSEWTGLRWGDVHEGDEGVWFTYRYKGGDTRKQNIPARLWQLILAYLRAAGRLPMKDEDYVFVALSDSGQYFRHVSGDYDPARQPISVRYVNDLLKRYGGQVGIKREKLHPHGLRHAGARHRRARGAEVDVLKDILGHASISTTQVYIDQVLDEPVDEMGALVVDDVMPKQLRMRFKV